MRPAAGAALNSTNQPTKKNTMKTKPPCVTLPQWLKNNLGPKCLAPLTSNDAKALSAAVQIVELYAYNPAECVVNAFGSVVSCMQDHTRHLAFHAVAHVMDWGHRAELWHRAGLGDIPQTRCNFEPK
jgi:hypothetical protein